jgi:WD40 repeat protein
VALLRKDESQSRQAVATGGVKTDIRGSSFLAWYSVACGNTLSRLGSQLVPVIPPNWRITMRAAVWVGAFAVLATGGTVFAQESKPNVLARLEGHRGGVSAMTFSPNPSSSLSLFATSAGNGVVRLWDAHSGKYHGTLDTQKHNGARINTLTFSADGFLLSSSSRNAVIVWRFFNPEPTP